MRPHHPPIPAIVGPTSAGKSRVALEVARRVGAEIVSVDSRQVYRYMDIGTAKPSAEERAAVPHHLIDVVDPDEPFTVVQFRDLALEAVRSIGASGRVPLLAGGTGFYFRALEGGPIAAVPPDPEFRRAMEERARAEGSEALHRELAALDPEAAARVHPRNVRRVIRALEVHHGSAGSAVPPVGAELAPPAAVAARHRPARAQVSLVLRKFGLTADRRALYEGIDGRVDQMLADGLVAEVEALVARGYGWDLPAMSGLGYRQIGQYLRGEVSLEEAVTRIKLETHRYARQQYAWFSPRDPAIRWFDVTEGRDAAVEEIARALVA